MCDERWAIKYPITLLILLGFYIISVKLEIVCMPFLFRCH